MIQGESKTDKLGDRGISVSYALGEGGRRGQLGCPGQGLMPSNLRCDSPWISNNSAKGKNRNSRGNYGQRHRPCRKCNLTPGSFPVKDSTREAFPRGQPAPPLVEIRNVTSHCPGACRPRSTRAPPLRTLSGFCPWVAGSSTEGAPSCQQDIHDLLTSAPSDSNLGNRTLKSQRPFGVWAQGLLST